MIQRKRTGIYLRVSKDAQSVENQLLDLRAVAAQRDWDVVEVYTDHGVSGSKRRDERPEFDRMATDAAKGRINYIAAWALDRIGRNSRDVINFITDLPEQGVGLYLHREQLDTSTPVGKFVLTIMAGLSEMELASIKARIDAGLRRARAAGKRLGRPRINRKIEERILNLRKDRPSLGIRKIAREIGVSASTVARVLAETSHRSPTDAAGGASSTPTHG